MSFFKRCGNLIKGFFNTSVESIEEKNPELLFEVISSNIGKARKEAEEKIVEVQTSAELIKMEMQEMEKSLGSLKSRIDTTKESEDRELLIDLLLKHDELDKAYEASKNAYDEATSQLSQIKVEYKQFDSELNTRLSELKSLKSQAQISALKENINSMNAKYVSKNNALGELNSSMERAKEIVNKKKARAEAVNVLNGIDTEQKIRRLDLDSARARAEEKADLLLKKEEE